MSTATAVSILIVAIPLIVGIVNVVYAWPAGTSEETKNEILTVILSTMS